jgi:hypothetical protein
VYNRRVFRRKPALALLTLIALGIGLWLARPGPITAVDQEQPRFDQAAPVPRGQAVLTQTLVANRGGFSAIDLLAVVYPADPPTAALTIEIRDSGGRVLAQRVLSGLAHNAPVQLSFPPQPHSAGQTYLLRLSGTPDNNATVWAYDLDGYLPGALAFDGKPQPGDLRFSTSYTYLWPSLAGDALAALGQLVVLSVPLALVLWVPGALLLAAFDPRGGLLRTAGARWGVALGLSATLLALAWLWAGVVGWHWSPASLGGAYIALGALAVARLAARLSRHRLTWPRPRPESLGLAAILLTSVVLRLLAVRDLSFPAWVDSPHHVLVARLLETSGQVPASYQPFLPIGVFYYHFAFHALTVTLHWLSGLSLVDTTLLLGQVLNGLMPLAAYALAWGVTGRRRAALAAALVVGLVAFFPGYFVNWGRYSQLTGLLVLGPAAGSFWRALRPAAGARKVAGQAIVVAAMLAAGVFLAHYRVLIFYVVFAFVALLAHLRQRRAWRGILLIGAGAMAISLPWLARLTVQAVLPLAGVPRGLASAEGYNAFPVDYFQSPLERGWLILALAAGIWGLWRRDRAVWAGLAWIAAVLAGLNLGSATWLVNNNSWAISLFLPGAMLVGWGADQWVHRARVWLAHPGRGHWRWRPALGAVLLAAAAGLAAYAAMAGARVQVAIVNPATQLATPADRQALEWLVLHLPAEAVVAVNGWDWLNGLWAGPDGGSWILPLTGRQTTLPPNDYAYGPQPYRDRINAFNAQLAQTSDANTPEFRALLQSAGVTHVYIGARGGSLKPEMFVSSPYYRLLYTNGLAWIFAVNGP